ncbi:MAG TPA: glycosyltransferase [Candidatus Kapabacteria bacterium]|nr:glycosyltransferase [Candidatus Kapabacteria bacterium]HOV91971.1 glycosyltransferase [Candidatus Kapabacteria bacterium]
MNILFLSARIPYPMIGGDRIKSFHLLQHLAKSHNVTLITFYQGNDNYREFQKVIEDIGVKVYVIPLNPIKATLASIPRLYQLKPLEIYFYYQNAFKKKIEEYLQSETPDLIISFFMRTAEYVKHLPHKKILIAEDSRILYQSRSAKDSKNIIQKLVRTYEVASLKHYEPHIMNYFDIVTFVTKEDIEFSKKWNPTIRYELLTNGTDVEKYIPSDFNLRKNIVFTGKLDLWANDLMIMRIVNNILPIIRQKFPNIRFQIIGAKAPNMIKKLTKLPNIELYENVPDFTPYLQKARVFLHPHLGGSGIQNKVLEAMSAGAPVVTTPSGNQGIYGIHREHLMIGNNDVELAQLAIEILENDELAQKISINGRQHILNTHSWEIIYKNMDDIISELFNEK